MCFLRRLLEQKHKAGGESGIRTHVTLSSKHAFQACAFSHSAISPAYRLGYLQGLSHRMRSGGGMLPFDSMGELTEPQLARADLLQLGRRVGSLRRSGYG